MSSELQKRLKSLAARAGISKCDPVQLVLAIPVIVLGIWGLLSGSVYLPNRHGGSLYGPPGSYLVCVALLILGGTLLTNCYKVKLAMPIWVVLWSAAVIFLLAGIVIGPTSR